MINLKELKDLCNNIVRNKSKCSTEEATKTSMILPFIKHIGYDIFNPKEFIPEYVADFGVKRGEKVDYAIKINGEISIIIEAKVSGKRLNDDVSQLFRYFSVTEAKFGVLTNGTEYRFYTDIKQRNIMDKKPFHTIYIDNLSMRDIDVLNVLHKDNYDYQKAYKLAYNAKAYNDVIDYLGDIENNRKIIEGIAKCIGISSIDDEMERVIGKALHDGILGEGDTIDSNKFVDNINKKYGDIVTYSECAQDDIKTVGAVDRARGSYEITLEEKEIINTVSKITGKQINAVPTKFNTRLSLAMDSKEQTFMILYRNGEMKAVWSFSINGYTGEETNGSRHSIKYSGDIKVITKYKGEIIRAIKELLVK